MKILYISGPFSDRDPVHGVSKHILQASEAALLAWHEGWAVVCPHKNSAGFQHVQSIPRKTWIEGDLEILRRCDAICMFGYWTGSRGACLEYSLARDLGIPIYQYSPDGLQLMPESLFEAYDTLARDLTATGAPL